MVATDVASRGIGMIKAPSPHAAKPSAYTVVALLSTLRRLLDCVILPGSFRVFWFSLIWVSWKCACSMFYATLVNS